MSYLAGTSLTSGTNNITTGTVTLGSIAGTISTPLVYSDYNNYNPCGEITLPNSFTSLNFNLNNMGQLRQSKIAIFEVTRDKKTNEITSSKFLQELWVEVKQGISFDLVAAKQLKGDFDPETIVVKEIQSIYF